VHQVWAAPPVAATTVVINGITAHETCPHPVSGEDLEDNLDDE
jgi:hypothetical protein